ncbi:MAG: endolytic transglycosylase MltG, partial [Solirubrobacterales bacterium]
RGRLARRVLGEGGGGGRGGRSSRRSRRSGGAGGNYRRRRVAALVLALVGILAVWFLVAFFQPFSGDGDGSGSVMVEILDGADAGEIATILDDAGVISSGRLFEWRLRLSGKSDDVQADTYSLAEGMSYGTAIERLTGEGGPSGLLTVTIPEGLDRQQIAADVLPEGVSSDEYLQLTETAPRGFNPARYGAKSRSVEGFLFPATYELQEGQGARELVRMQLDAFQQNIGQLGMRYAKKKNLTVYDVLIIASMVDKEVQVPKERRLVAAVIYNRLSKGIPLGIDATTRFETQNYTEQIPQSDLDADTPYNTRLNQGLTPTPIGNPGLAAIKAAANPARVNHLYFVVKPDTCGEHTFTASEKEFERLAAEYQRALQEQGGSPTECPE